MVPGRFEGLDISTTHRRSLQLLPNSFGELEDITGGENFLMEDFDERLQQRLQNIDERYRRLQPTRAKAMECRADIPTRAGC